jgi:integrase
VASITHNRKNGRKTVQFIGLDGKRRSLRLGKVQMETARTVKMRVEAIVSAMGQGVAIDSETAKWIGSLDDQAAAKLASVGLAGCRQKALLGPFVEEFIKKRKGQKPNTLIAWGQTHKRLVRFFGEGKPIRDITPDECNDWRRKMKEWGLGENTIGRQCGFAKQFFATAVDARLLQDNPFRKLKSTVRGNRERSYFVTRDQATAVIEACPTAEWRLLFALSRYGGLRCPSEHLSLRWTDIDWERSRIRVRSPKTEHLPGRASRLIPIFAELKPFLEESFTLAEDGAEFVIQRYREGKTNLRTQLERIITRAGFEPWPRLWHNLRATRQTELEESFPSHVVCAWLGNTEKIAREFYLNPTDDHFSRAAKGGAKSGAAQHALAANEATGETVNSNDHEKTPEFSGVSSQCQPFSTQTVDRGRIELPTPGFSVLCSTN